MDQPVLSFRSGFWPSYWIIWRWGTFFGIALSLALTSALGLAFGWEVYLLAAGPVSVLGPGWRWRRSWPTPGSTSVRTHQVLRCVRLLPLCPVADHRAGAADQRPRA